MSADLEHELREMGARLLADAPPVTTAEVLEHRLGEVAVMNGAPVEVPVVREITAPRSASRWRWTAAIGTVAAAAVVAVGVSVVARDGDGEPQSVGAAPTTLETGSVAEASASTALDPPAANTATPLPAGAELAWPPRVLLDDSWEVVTASERSVDEGYVSFERHGVVVFVNWYRGPAVGAEWDPRDGTAVGPASLLGHDVTIYSSALSYRAGDVAALVEEGLVTDERIVADFESGGFDPDDLIGGAPLDEALAEAVAGGLIERLPTQGLQTGYVENASSLSVQVMTADPAKTLTEAEFAELLAGVRQFTAADWEAAMPDRVVTPDEREAVIAELTADVPVPDGWLGATSGAALTQDRIDVAGFVAQSILCAWVTQYFSAEPETAPPTEALEAIATSASWPATRELTASWDHEEPGVIPTPNNGAVGVTVDGDTLMYDGEPLDGFFAAQLCDMNAVG